MEKNGPKCKNIAKKIGDRKAKIMIGIGDLFSNNDRNRDHDRSFHED